MNKHLKLLMEISNLADIYHHDHPHAVKKIAATIGRKIKLSTAEREYLTQGALLHDIGKLLLPHDILNKPEKLDEEERVIIQRHSRIGANLLEKAGYPEPVILTVKHHHERWDGTGYPDGLKDEKIPYLARIVTIADAYHVMISENFYSTGLTREEAVAEIKNNSGKQFCPELVDVFTEIISDLEICP